MNKTELVASVSDKAGVTKAQAGDVIDAFVEAVTEALQGGDDVRIVGFGSFQVAKRAASVRSNPRTGEKMKVPAANVPKFKAGKGLKEAVNTKPKKARKKKK
jgi:DNA-binding protein HU-beta